MINCSLFGWTGRGKMRAESRLLWGKRAMDAGIRGTT